MVQIIYLSSYLLKCKRSTIFTIYNLNLREQIARIYGRVRLKIEPSTYGNGTAIYLLQACVTVPTTLSFLHLDRKCRVRYTYNAMCTYISSTSTN